MASTHLVNVIPVTATFYPERKGNEMLAVAERLDMPHGLNKIVIQLVTESRDGGVASFAADPPGAVIWLDAGGHVIATPPAFQVIREEQRLVIWDANATTYEISHRFWLVIEYQGETYYKDPTIINQKPVQPTLPPPLK